MWKKKKIVCLHRRLPPGSPTPQHASIHTTLSRQIKSSALIFQFTPLSLYISYHTWKLFVAKIQDLIAIQNLKTIINK